MFHQSLKAPIQFLIFQFPDFSSLIDFLYHFISYLKILTMDFSQPNKINSGQHQSRNFQNFNPQQNQNLQSNSFPSFQHQQPATSSPYNYQFDQQQYSVPNFREADRNQQHQFVQQNFSGGDLIQDSKNFYQTPQLTQPLQQLSLTRQSHEQDMMNRHRNNFVQRSSFESAPPMIENNNLQSSYFMNQQQVYCDEDDECDDPNAKVTHFQYPPRSVANKMEKMPNPFAAIIEPMKKINNSNREVKLKPPKNHQTFIFKHQDEDEQDSVEENFGQHKTFQSHTKITRISNGGVRIVTDIFRDESQKSNSFGADQSASKKNSIPNHFDDMNEWIGKSIEVTVDANSCEISNDDHLDQDDDEANDVREDC